MLVCACLFQAAFGTIIALTRLPLCDEGFYGVPAHILSVTGALRNPVLESAGITYLYGIDRAFYWMAPVGMVLQAAAFKVFGFGLLVERELSVICGLGAILGWYLTLRRLMGEQIASLSALLLSADFVFLALSSLGRVDMISVFFSMAALAAYMGWRERHLTLALAAANTACALSGMAHPNGGIAAVVSLTVLAIGLDRKRLRRSDLAIVAACYGVWAAGWGLYIAQAPRLFVIQFFGNISNRLAGPMTLKGLSRGEANRYVSAYGLPFSLDVRLLRWLVPVSYLAAVLSCVLSKEWRRRAGTLILMFAAVSLSLVFLEGAKQGWYLVHLSPLFAAFLAIAMIRLWKSRATLARIVVIAQAVIVLIGVAGLAYSSSRERFQRLYHPAVMFLNDHIQPGDLVFARSEFYFGLNCRTCLRDDDNLGVLSGRQASYIVIDPDYEQYWSTIQGTNPGLYRKIEQRLMEYREVFRNANYRVVWRGSASS
jgi:4-amino-4-deoxy-L-arabinose transferase-like glycosyltransferase